MVVQNSMRRLRSGVVIGRRDTAVAAENRQAEEADSEKR